MSNAELSSSTTADSPRPASTTKSRRLAQCFARGLDLKDSEKGFSYAHAMFAECVLHEPANLGFAEALLANLATRFPERRARSIVIHPNLVGYRLKVALRRKCWSEVIRIGIEHLEADPWNVVVLRAIAQACAGLHCNESELAYLKHALDAHPKDSSLNRHCADSLARMGQFDQAIACWHRIEVVRNGDPEATRMISRLYEEKLKYPNGRPPEAAANSPSQAATPEDTSADCGESLAVQLSARQELEFAIAQNPREASNYIRLAKLLVANEHFRQTIELLNRGIAECGKVPELIDCLRHCKELQTEREQRLAKRREQSRANAKRRLSRITGIELALVFTSTLFILQLFTSDTLIAAIRLLDVRDWTRSTWFVVNILIATVLIGVRWWPKVRKKYEDRALA